MTISSQFYKNFEDVTFIFNNSEDNVRACIMNADELKLSQKALLLKGLHATAQSRALSNITNVTNAIKLSLQVERFDYVRSRFSSEITDENFVEFSSIVDLLPTTSLLRLNYCIANPEFNEQFYSTISSRKYEDFISIINNCNAETLDFICRKRPSVVNVIESESKALNSLTGRNLFRVIINTLKRDNSLIGLNRVSKADIQLIKHIAKNYMEKAVQIIIGESSGGFNYCSELINLLVEANELTFSRQLYDALPEEKQTHVNKQGYAFYSGFDVTELTSRELRNCIELCTDQHLLLEKIGILSKESIINFIKESCYLESFSSEMILLNTLSLLEISKTCEFDSTFARLVIGLISDERIIRQFSTNDWFWNTLKSWPHSVNLSKLTDKIDFNVMLTQFNSLGNPLATRIFQYYFAKDINQAFDLFEKYNAKFKLVIESGKLDSFISKYGLDYIVELCHDHYDRRTLMEIVPLGNAMKIVNILNLTEKSEEFKCMHGGRKKALVRRINA